MVEKTKKKKTFLTLKDKVQLGAMTVPAIIIYSVFLVVPIGMAFYFSFHTWNGIQGSPMEFAGLKNFTRTFSDKLFTTSVSNLIKMVFFSVLCHTPIALVLAVFLNTKIKGKRFFKIIYFVPTIFPLTAVGLLWYFIFMPNGSFNSLLVSLGLADLVTGWLINPQTAMPTVIFVNIWAGIGYYMVILLAGLKGIPEELYEAGIMDGATPLQSFFKITIPMLRPTLILCVVLDIIGTVKIFDLVFVMTGGGPNGLTNLPTTLVYDQAFKYDNYGVGSAIGIILLGMTLVATFLGTFVPKIIEKRRAAND